jgi:glycine/D-amino acid oxidase-like deaminating enzyme
MARIVMIGGGIVGLGGAMLLQRDGHDVTLIERDPQPPPVPGAAWTSWARRGVGQFRHAHSFLARFAAVVREELPELARATGRSARSSATSSTPRRRGCPVGDVRATSASTSSPVAGR